MGKDDSTKSEQSNASVGSAITGVTGTVGAVVGGVTRTTGGLVGATGRGVGGTINNASGTKPFGNTVQALTDGVEYGVQAISRGIEDGSRGKRPGSTDSEWDHR